MNAGDFIAALKPNSATQQVLLLGYFVEVVEGAGKFTTGDISGAFTAARLQPPQNISDLIAKLRLRGDIIRLNREAHALSHDALASVTNLMNDSGLFATEPVESTRLIREVSEKLHTDVLQIADGHEREFIVEALACLHPSVNAYRAAVIMGWAAVVHNLREKLRRHPLTDLDKAVKRHHPKKKIEKPDDLHDLKDSELLLLCSDQGLFDKNVRKILEHDLDLRNASAHPTSVRPGLHAVRAFFEEVIQYVLAVP